MAMIRKNSLNCPVCNSHYIDEWLQMHEIRGDRIRYGVRQAMVRSCGRHEWEVADVTVRTHDKIA